MKAKRVLYCIVVGVFLLCTLSMSVMGVGNTFTHTFSTRGDARSNSSEHVITGKICRMALNFITVRMDANTPIRNVKYIIEYRTTGLLGIMGVADYEIVLDEDLGNSSSQSMAESYSMGQRAFVDASYDGDDVASMRGYAEGADNHYYFEIVRAMFTFSNT